MKQTEDEVLDTYSLDPTQPQYLTSYARLLQQKVLTAATAMNPLSKGDISLVIIIQSAEAMRSSLTSSSSLLSDILNFFALHLSLPVTVLLTHNNSCPLPFPLDSSVSDKVTFVSPIFHTASPITLLDSFLLDILAPEPSRVSLPVTLSPDCLLWIRSEFLQNEYSVLSAVQRSHFSFPDILAPFSDFSSWSLGSNFSSQITSLITELIS
jgi:hypothetical protein